MPDNYIWVMIKQIPVILLLTAFLGQTFSKCIIFFNYQLKKNYIATFLCENRNKPEMKCEGKCYLCKRLKNENKKDQENPERKAENKFEIISFVPRFEFSHPGFKAITFNYPHYQESVYSSFTQTFFHPPQSKPLEI